MPSYLWQNFLEDIKYKKIILEIIEKSKKEFAWENLIEIWPWKGSISKYLVDKYENITFFEKDENFYNIIKNFKKEKQKIIIWDVLQSNLNNFNKNKTFIFWNIPYYITSPIFKKFFVENNFIWWLILIQKEVWKKIKSDANKKSFLRWLLNYWYEIKYIETVPAKAFNPIPKVDSCLVYLSKLSNKKNINLEEVINFLDIVNRYKRKTLWKISNIINKKWIYKYNIQWEISKKRIEELNWDDIKYIIDYNKE